MTQALIDDAGNVEPEAQPSRVLRGVEFGLLFVVTPAAFVLLRVPMGWMMPTMIGFALVCLATLLVDKTFARRQLWNFAWLRIEAQRILSVFAIGLSAMLLLVIGLTLMRQAGWANIPEQVSPGAFPLGKPVLWVVVMFLYPLFSVYPQELIYRAFFFHRYATLFPGRWTMIVMSAAAFGWAHVVLENSISVVLTVAAGLLFAFTYERSRSIAAVWFEHTLYGCGAFTVGIGWFFYAGAVR